MKKIIKLLNKKEHLMKYKIISAIICYGVLISGCESNTIKDDKINDRVKACSAGFSEDIQAQLHASLNKIPLSGGIGADIKEETKSLIFAETPVEQHLQVYEDYIKCVEDNWN